MEKPTKRELCIFTVVFAVILFCWLCRVVGTPGPSGYNVVRSTLYPALYIYWGFTLKRRLIHPQVRRFCISIAALNVFWFLMRTIKYMTPNGGPNVTRYLWYLYYVGFLFIPVFGLLMALSVGLPEGKRLPKKTAVLYFITGALLLLVLTNDLHQLVFVFPDNGLPWGDDDYSYSIGYYLVSAWMIGCDLASLAVLAVKSRRPGGRRWVLLPCVPSLLIILYWASYATGRGIVYYFHDVTAFSCAMAAASVEICIQCGLVRSNTGYRELFRAGSLGAQILDAENSVCLSSTDAVPLTKEQITAAETQPVLLSDSVRLRSRPIRFGHVLWQEDISELTEAIAQAEENLQELAEQNRIRRESIEAEKEILALQEKNRAEDLLHRETASQLALIDRLLGRYAEETGESERRRLLAGAAVVGAYIKRYGNLLLVRERSDTADMTDLARCFEESFINLELLGTECLCTLPSGMLLRTADMLRIYRAFEGLLEDCLFDLHHVWANARERNGVILLSVELVCDTDLSGHAAEADDYSFESGTARFTFRPEKGGAAE